MFRRWWRRLPLRAKTLAVLAVPLAPLLLSAALVMATARRENAAQDLVAHTLEVKAQVATIGGLLADAEVGVRGFLLTRHPDSLKSYDDATSLLVPVGTRLMELVRDDPEQMRRLRTLAALTADRPLTALLDYARDPESPSSAPPDLLTRSRETMIALRAVLAAMQDTEDELLAQRIALARRARDHLVAAVIGGAALGLLGGLGAAAAFSAGITRRIHLARANAGRLAQGHPLDPAPDAADELGVLTRQLIDVGTLLSDRVRELEAARDELDRFFSVSLDLLCIADTNGMLTRLNPAWQEVLGWSVDELTAAPYLDFVHPDDRAGTAGEARRVASGEAVVNFENRYRCKDGTYRWLNWKAAAAHSGGAIYAAARDVTEERRIREQLHRRMAELAELNQELEAFSYSVSHDLRAPLRHITGFASLLERSAGAKLDREERRRLNAVTDAAARLGRLIDDLLAFSRMSRAAVARQRVRLEDIVSEARTEVTADPAAQRVAWKVAPLPEVEGDPVMLRQAFVNLLQNAVKYTRRRPDATVEIGTNEGSGETVVFVRDNGVGFDMQYAHKLFGVFQRLHNADDFEGTGIGLASVRRIIHRHGGRTWAEGEVDRGATFYLALPTSLRAGTPPEHLE